MGATSLGMLSLPFLVQNKRPYTIVNKVHEAPRTYPEENLYWTGDFVVAGATGRTIYDAEDYVLELSRPGVIISTGLHGPVQTFEQIRVYIDKNTFESVKKGETFDTNSQPCDFEDRGQALN